MSASVSWDATDDAVTDVYVSVSDGRIYEVPASLSSLQVSGLRNGTSYEFVVRAATKGGVGPAVSVRAVPLSGLEGEVAGLVVKFEPGVAVTDGQEAVPGEAAVLQADLTADSQVADGVRRVELSHPVSRDEAKQIAQELTADPAVAWAEPDGFVTMSADSAPVLQDADYAQQWNLWDAFGVGVGAGTASAPTASAYADGQGEGATVAVIDTGITAHPDLESRILPGYDFVSSPSTLSAPREFGVPNAAFDGDSVDAAKYGPLGWDDNPTDPGDWRQTAPARNSSWHGTHVAGVIAAQPNTQGVAGLAPRARILPVRALSWRGGLMSDVAASITWATGGVVDGVGVNPNPADVVNLSFAMSGSCPASLQAAIDDANARGAVVVAAAGNANDDVANWAPANCTGVIAVGATGRDGKRAPYSNWGAGIDVSAPGGGMATDGGVLSTANAGLTGAGEPAYAAQEGTSVAAAHVSAIAARIAGANPTLTPAEITTRLTGRTAVRAFAGDACDADPARTCGSGIVQIATAGDPGVTMAVTVGGAPVADGSTVAVGSVVGLGTSGLLSPGTGDRVLRTSLHAGTVYRAGTAEAPEGWTIEYSTNNGTSWSSSEPGTPASVTDVRASKSAVSAGLIEGSSQVYSTETSSAIPSSTFLANAGGDGFNVFFYEDQIFNIFHHSGSTSIMCHIKSTSARCPGFSSAYTFSGYQTSMRSTGWVDAATGRLYAYAVYNSNVWVLCLDVSTSTPTSCGTTQMTTSGDVGDWTYLSEGVAGSGRLYATESAGTPSLLCFDMTTGAACSSSPKTLLGSAAGGFEQSIYRPGFFGDKIYAITTSHLYCFSADMSSACSGSWPVAVSQWTSGVKGMGIAPHVNASQAVDGVCYFINGNAYSCLNLDGTANATWKSPFILGVPEHPHIALGVATLGRFYYGAGRYSVGCWDYGTNAACTGFGSSGYKNFGGGVGIVYGVSVDPQNPACLWMNSDAGYIYNFDAYTGADGCSSNPVITLQPSQFAPRYACSTDAGITEWTALRLVSLAGGGNANSVKLTVRKASGDIVSGWNDVPVTLGQDLDMTGLDPAVSGSRPTFSFAFSGITGTISTAVIALDYKGKGPELCVQTTATAPTTPRSVTVTGTLTESVGATETFTVTRSFTIGSSSSLVVQTVPGPLRDLSGSGLNTSATVTFRAPASDGGTPITGYQYSMDGGSTWSDASVVDNGDGTYTFSISGLTANRTYAMRGAAVNAMGRGQSAAMDITTQLVTISTLVDTAVNQGPVSLAPTSSAGLTITYTASPSTVCTVAGSTVTLVGEGVCSLVADQAGDPSRGILPATDTGSFTVLPPYYAPTVPGEPTGLTASPANGQVSLSWTAPVDDGHTAITDYVVQVKTGSSWIPFIDGVSTGTTALVTGLTNGTTYAFRVAAVNAQGTGSFGTSVNATPATIPGAPTSLAATGTGTSRTLTWSAPGSNGGSAITDYIVEVKLSADASWSRFADGVSSSTGATVTGLVNGSTYDFQVTTVNAVGSSSSTSTVNLTASAGAGQVTLSWVAPASPGGTITDYEMQFRESGTASWATFSDAVSTATGGTVTGLVNGTAYDFRVATIVNGTTTSSYTSVVSATPRTTPSAPSPVTTTPGNRQVALSWSAPSNGGSAITDYVIEYRPSTGGSWSTFTDGVSSSTGATVTGLLNGTSYDFRVTSQNAVGSSSVSATVGATPRTVPGAPGTVTATAGNGSAALSWSAPSSNGGSAVTDYLIEVKTSAALTWTVVADGVSTATTSSLADLTNGTTYNVRIAAVNEAGTGAYATTVSVTPRGAPGAPRNLSLASGSQQLTATWEAPSSNGGNAITDYVIEYRPRGTSSWTTVNRGSTSVSQVLSSLTNGTRYEVRVAAVNAVGTGAYATVVEGTPRTLPGAPTAVTATSGSGAISLTWTAPANDGGAAITDYVIEVQDPVTLAWSTYADAVSDATSAALSGLTVGTTYDLRVSAVNEAGQGPASSTAQGTPGAASLGGTVAGGSASEDAANTSRRVRQANGPLRLRTPAVTVSVTLPADETPVMQLQAPEPVWAPAGSWVQVAGDGFAPNSVVTVSLLPKPTARTVRLGVPAMLLKRSGIVPLGTVTARGDGTFDTLIQMPASIDPGSYVLSLDGLSVENESRALQLEMQLMPSASSPLQKSAFFKPRSKAFSAAGIRKLSTLAVKAMALPGARVIQVTGVSLSMGSLERNVDMAAARAKRIVRYLQAQGVSGTYEVTFRTSGTLSPQRAKPKKPLSTVEITFPVS